MNSRHEPKLSFKMNLLLGTNPIFVHPIKLNLDDINQIDIRHTRNHRWSSR